MPGVQQTDTIVPVDPDARLRLDLMRGDVTIRTWDRSEMRIVADHDERDRIEISAGPAVVRINARAYRGVPADVDLQLTVPRSMGVEMEGPFLDVDIRGSEGEVTVETVQGDIHLEGGRRFVTLHSVQGDVHCSGAAGRINIGSANGDLHVLRSSGEMTLEGVNGEIFLTDVESEVVRATTVNGEISYRGTLRDNGQYSFATHNGDLMIAIPAGTNATVSVSTHMGEFEADFPVTLQDMGPRTRFNFVLGSGGARIQLESFGGTIYLRRP
jgi:DUF4097 and DUF4098 domain-containing protein YvlB